MKTPRSLILLFSSWLVLNASSLYLDGRRHPRLEESSVRTDENSIGVRPQSLERDLFEHIEGAGRERSAGEQRSFIDCVFKFNGTGKPEYACDHSRDVEIKWHEGNDRIMGTFETNFHCPKQRSVANEIQRPRNRAVQKWKHSIREKRRAVYSDDTGEEEVHGEAAEQTDEEETVAPEVTSQAAAEEDIAEESQLAQPPDVEEETTAEEEKEAPLGEVENDEGEDKGRKEVNEDDTAGTDGSSEDKEISGIGEDAEEVAGEEGEDKGRKEVSEDDTASAEGSSEEKKVPGTGEDAEEVESEEGEDKGRKEVNEDDTASAEGSSEDKEIPGTGEDAEEVEKEVNTVEKEEDQAADVDDKEVPARGASEGDGGREEYNDRVSEDESPVKNDKKARVGDESTTTEDKNSDKTDDKTAVAADDYELKPLEGVFEFEIELDKILPMDKITTFVADVGTIIYDTGDYILSLLLGDMKRSLRVARINERFNAKVDEIAKSHDGDSGKALSIMEKRIHGRFGKSYEFEIIKLLKDLRDGLKP